jgi:hypothetical protein
LGAFGRIEVWLVDPVDIFVGKVFSRRLKDRDDLRALSKRLSKDSILTRLPAAASLAVDAKLTEAARKNWYVVYGEGLPL